MKTTLGNPALMTKVRRIHTYIGALIAPSVLFFACSGALQLFSLHEAHGTYQPSAFVAQIGSIHKHQVLMRAPSPGGADDDHDHHGGAREGGKAPPSWSASALKWVFLAVAAGLATSTLFGVWLALASSRRRRLIVGLLIVGALVPAVLALV